MVEDKYSLEKELFIIVYYPIVPQLARVIPQLISAGVAGVETLKTME